MDEFWLWLFWVASVAIVYPYFIYPVLLLLIRPFLFRRASQADDGYQPTVSIILAAYNEEDCIHEKLENCLALDYPSEKVEILVGSDASEDRTNEIAETFASRGIRLFPYTERGEAKCRS